MPSSIFVSCPICRNTSLYNDCNPYRPFCSERCKLIDLGAWADESYRIEDQADNPENDTQTSLPDLAS
ncbi:MULTISPECIES: DNA gyrase inhibitor YacG [Deefgea]|uniref:DNA gyrase inhibitor YacG n=1 Tax=Deefgea chitinilytica TaxID=570276 RepID=A0ABS2CCJ5_9NEIS|nr:MULTISPECIES: DNA gyrase inhibitor YacG [Deefgea]MBM5571878.1 DNA gyrase inhibitor YacG [Deefgea chitinilytica]MBM9889113.1 DNA gyrase inhibitor YacG [Deefgea sp. CFH1-16]